MRGRSVPGVPYTLLSIVWFRNRTVRRHGVPWEQKRRGMERAMPAVELGLRTACFPPVGLPQRVG